MGTRVVLALLLLAVVLLGFPASSRYLDLRCNVDFEGLPHRRLDAVCPSSCNGGSTPTTPTPGTSGTAGHRPPRLTPSPPPFTPPRLFSPPPPPLSPPPPDHNKTHWHVHVTSKTLLIIIVALLSVLLLLVVGSISWFCYWRYKKNKTRSEEAGDIEFLFSQGRRTHQQETTVPTRNLNQQETPARGAPSPSISELAATAGTYIRQIKEWVDSQQAPGTSRTATEIEGH